MIIGLDITYDEDWIIFSVNSNFMIQSYIFMFPLSQILSTNDDKWEKSKGVVKSSLFLLGTNKET